MSHSDETSETIVHGSDDPNIVTNLCQSYSSAVGGELHETRSRVHQNYKILYLSFYKHMYISEVPWISDNMLT